MLRKVKTLMVAFTLILIASVNWAVFVYSDSVQASNNCMDDASFVDKYWNKEVAYTIHGSEIVVSYSDGITRSECNLLASEYQLTVIHELQEYRNIVHYRIEGNSDVLAICDKIRMRNQVLSAYPVLLDEEMNPKPVVGNELAVQFKSDCEVERCLYLISEMGSVLVDDRWTPGYYIVTVPDGLTLFQSIRAYNELDQVRFAGFHGVFSGKINHEPNDERYSDQWNLNNTGQISSCGDCTPYSDHDIKAEGGWDVSMGDPDIIIAIIDTGCDMDHDDLEDNILDRNGEDWDFFDPFDDDPEDEHGHGTKVAGVVAARSDNWIGVAGIAPRCRLMPLRTGNGELNDPAIVDAINYAASRRSDYDGMILSNSWSLDSASSQIDAAIEDAYNLGCVIVFSVGNNDANQISEPSDSPYCISVGALSPCGERASPNSCDGEDWGSNYGAKMDLTAPGVFIATTVMDNDYTLDFKQTSAACPHVSGVAALMLSINSHLTPDHVERLLLSTADDIGPAGFDIETGWGRVNAAAALDVAQEYPNGMILNRYDGPGGMADSANAITVDTARNYYVAGSSIGSDGGVDFVTIKYGPDGEELWVARYDGLFNGGDVAEAVAVDAGGYVYVTGSSEMLSGHFDYTTVKYGPDGTELWVRTYDGGYDFLDKASAIALDDMGNVYVTGTSIGGLWWTDYVTIKYDFHGDEQWVAVYDGPGNDNDEATAIAVDGTGNVFVTGNSVGSGTGEDYATIKYNTNGNQLWVARYNGSGNAGDEAKSLGLDESGNVFITGFSYGAGGDKDIVSIKYDDAGHQLWARRYDGLGNHDDEGKDLAIDGAGNLLVAGLSYAGSTGNDTIALKYDADGDELWVRQYDGPDIHSDSDIANAIAVDASGNVYVAGELDSDEFGSYVDYITIKYDTAGNEVWVEFYDGPNGYNDVPVGIEVDGSGRVYVTGSSGGDIATIVYAQPYSGTVSSSLLCTPSHGTVPFVSTMGVVVTNLYDGQVRRMSCHVDVVLANGNPIPNWRAGYTNIMPEDSYFSFWNTTFPAIGTVIGQNVFTIVAEDVTPSPYNQPPYPPAGDTAGDVCTVTGIAP